MEAYNRRRELIRQWKDHPNRQRFRAQAIEYARRDTIACFDLFFWTFNTRLPAKDRACPFLLRDYQPLVAKVVEHCIDNGRDLYVAKSRDMGLSWQVDGVILKKWRYEQGFMAHLGSKKADDVDTIGNLQTLMERIRWNLRQIDKATPGWTPAGWEKSWKAHLIRNPQNGSQITGEGATESFGRQFRANVVHFSEISQIDESLQEAIMTGLSQTCPCNIYETTPMGVGGSYADSVLPMIGNPAYEVDMLTGRIPWDEKAEREGVKQKPLLMLIHWTLDPQKAAGAWCFDDKGGRTEFKTCGEAYAAWRAGYNGMSSVEIRSPWYDAEKERILKDPAKSGRAIGQELNLDFISSGSPVFDPKVVQRCMALTTPPLRQVKILPDLWKDWTPASA